MNIDLSPEHEPAEIIDAIWAIRRANRMDLLPDVAALLDHPSPLVREEVLSLLFAKWKDRSMRGRLVEILRSDPDFGVRSRAAGIIALLSSDGSRSGEEAALRSTMLNPNEDSIVRKACYEALYQIRFGKPIQLEDEADLGDYLQQDWVWKE